MVMTESLDYFDAIDYLSSIKLQESIQAMNEEFTQWLIENEFYQEASPPNNKGPWQQEMISSIQNIVTQTMQYAFKEIQTNKGFLNREKNTILNLKQFPPKPSEYLKNSTNYQAAIQRLSAPFGSGLGGLDLSKVDDNAKANLPLKKALIPTYDGKSDFAQFAKLYYYGGEGQRSNLTPQQVGQLMQIGYQFCTQYEARLQALQNDVRVITNFIQQNPQTGQIQNQTQSDLAKIQAMQSNKAVMTQGMASTNPGANVGVARPVNADTDFDLFMKHYFEDDETDIINEADPVVSGNKPVSPVTSPKETKPTPPQSLASNGPDKDFGKPRGVPVDSKALAGHKQEIAAGIVRDVLAAKLAALGMVYRDFMMIMRTHVSAHKGANAANYGMPPPQQKQQVPQQQPQPNQAMKR